MTISKKDRIALSLSFIVLLFSLFLLFGNDEEIAALMFIGVTAYWGYRFIKNDISFIKVKEPE